MIKDVNEHSKSVRIENFYINLSRFIDLTVTFDGSTLENYYEFIDKRFQSLHAGEKINVTENRSVNHYKTRENFISNTDIDAVSNQDMRQFFNFMKDFENGEICNQNGEKFKHIINIGIGGSYLGPEMLFMALSDRYTKLVDGRFISNLDPLSFKSAVNGLDPTETLFIISSKSFTTPETLMNFTSAKKWLEDAGVLIENNIVAITANPKAASDMGIATDMILSFDENIGGRFAISSPISLIVGLSYGSEVFQEFLRGLNAVDFAVRNHEPAKRVLYHHALGYVSGKENLDIDTVAILPYSEALVRLPAYLQQLFMESLGKTVALSSNDPVQAGLVIFGEPGTSSQHSFMQFLHQGSKCIAAEFIAVKPERDDFFEARRLLSMNALAQSEALECGRSLSDIDSAIDFREHRVIAGNKPNVFIILDNLNAFAIGELISWYENLVIALGFLWDINAFDQFGVELGKDIAKGFTNNLNVISNPITRELFDELFNN